MIIPLECPKRPKASETDGRTASETSGGSIDPGRSDGRPVGVSLGRVTAEFSRCDQTEAVHRIRVLIDSGFDEATVVNLTGWSTVDVRRVLGGRT